MSYLALKTILSAKVKISFAYCRRETEKVVSNFIVQEIEKNNLAIVFWRSFGTCVQKSGDGTYFCFLDPYNWAFYSLWAWPMVVYINSRENKSRLFCHWFYSLSNQNWNFYKCIFSNYLKWTLSVLLLDSVAWFVPEICHFEIDWSEFHVSKHGKNGHPPSSRWRCKLS